MGAKKGVKDQFLPNSFRLLSFSCKLWVAVQKCGLALPSVPDDPTQLPSKTLLPMPPSWGQRHCGLPCPRVPDQTWATPGWVREASRCSHHFLSAKEVIPRSPGGERSIMAYNELLEDDTKHTHKHTLLGWGGSSPNWMGPRSISRMAVSVAVSPWQSPKCGQGDPSPGKEGLQDSPKQLPWEWLSGSSQEGDTRSSPILPPPQSQALWLPLPPNPVPYPPIPPPSCETNCSQRAPLPAALPLWSSRWPPPLGGGKNGDGEGRGLSSQAGKQGLLKWPQQACWYLKDSGEGGGQRLGGSLPGGWWRSWGWG